jgi:hypothetical protein
MVAESIKTFHTQNAAIVRRELFVDCEASIAVLFVSSVLITQLPWACTENNKVPRGPIRLLTHQLPAEKRLIIQFLMHHWFCQCEITCGHRGDKALANPEVLFLTALSGLSPREFSTFNYSNVLVDRDV